MGLLFMSSVIGTVKRLSAVVRRNTGSAPQTTPQMSATPPITVRDLNPFPLPKSLASLPDSVVQDFARLYELVKGFTQSLESYKTQEADVLKSLDEAIELINEITEKLQEQRSMREEIIALVTRLDDLYKDFLSLETYQYRLLGNNFNRNVLRTRFEKVMRQQDDHALDLISDYRRSDGNMSEFLGEFRSSRKAYHMTREKLWRWDEERISGFH